MISSRSSLGAVAFMGLPLCVCVCVCIYIYIYINIYIKHLISISLVSALTVLTVSTARGAWGKGPGGIELFSALNEVSV